jgi:hypothetical protein
VAGLRADISIDRRALQFEQLLESLSLRATEGLDVAVALDKRLGSWLDVWSGVRCRAWR